MNNNMDMSKMLEALSKMSKSELEAGISKGIQILKGKYKEEIFNELKKNNN